MIEVSDTFLIMFGTDSFGVLFVIFLQLKAQCFPNFCFPG